MRAPGIQLGSGCDASLLGSLAYVPGLVFTSFPCCRAGWAPPAPRLTVPRTHWVRLGPVGFPCCGAPHGLGGFTHRARRSLWVLPYKMTSRSASLRYYLSDNFSFRFSPVLPMLFVPPGTYSLTPVKPKASGARMRIIITWTAQILHEGRSKKVCKR